MVSRPELEGLLSALFTGSKRRWGIGTGLESIAVLGGAVSVIFELTAPWTGVLIAVAALTGSLLRWWADVQRSHAEELLRAKELRDGLGWAVDRKYFADLRADYSSLGSAATARQQEQRDFYDTNEAEGPRRLVAMMRESTWWSERLARLCFRSSFGMVVFLVVASLYALPFAELLRTAPLGSDELISLYTSLICLVFSGNLARLIVGYSAFSDAARGAYDRLDALTREAKPEERAILSVVIKYQFARSAAPPIPDFVWRLRRSVLEKTWDDELSDRE